MNNVNVPPVKLKKGPGPDPARGIHGFVLYLGGFLCFALYIVWAYFSPDLLYSIGLTYWPQRYWAIALPVYLTCMAVLFFIFLAAYNLLTVEPFHSIHSIQDDRVIRTFDDKSDQPQMSIPRIQDVPLDVYCRRMYYISHNMSGEGTDS